LKNYTHTADQQNNAKNHFQLSNSLVWLGYHMWYIDDSFCVSSEI